MSTVPTLEKVMVAEAVIEPPQQGTNGLGIYNVPSGTLTGDGFSAKIVPPSGDWSRMLSDTVIGLDVRLSAIMDDGSLIYITYPGRVVLNEAIAPKAGTGEEIDGSEMYFTTTPSVETNAPDLQWMNDTLFVGKMQTVSFAGAKPGRLVYHIYKIV